MRPCSSAQGARRAHGRHPRLPAGPGRDTAVLRGPRRLVGRHPHLSALRPARPRAAAPRNSALPAGPAQGGARHTHRRDVHHHRGRDRGRRLGAMPHPPLRAVDGPRPPLHCADIAGHGHAARRTRRTSARRRLLPPMVQGCRGTHGPQPPARNHGRRPGGHGARHRRLGRAGRLTPAMAHSPAPPGTWPRRAASWPTSKQSTTRGASPNTGESSPFSPAIRAWPPCSSAPTLRS